MSNPNVVGQAFIQLQFDFDQNQLQQQAQAGVNKFQQALQSGSGPARRAGQSVGDAFSKGVEQGQKRVASSIIGLISQFNRLPSAAQHAAGGVASAFQKMAASVANVTGQVQGTFSTLNSVAGPTTDIMKGVAGGFAGIVGAAGALTAVGANAAREFQSIEQGLKAMFGELQGTTEQTDAFVAGLRDLSQQSGQSFNQLAMSGRQLIATGLSAEETIGILTDFAKAAALSGASTRQFELALLGLTQVQAKGRLSSEELRRQIAENLPGAISVTKVYEELAKQLDLTTAEVVKLQEAGGITASQGIDAIRAAIQNTAGISEAFEARLSTLDGQLGVLRETFNEVLQVGFKPFVSALATGFKELQTSGAFDDIQKEFEDFSKVMGTVVVDTIRELLPIIPDLVKTFTELAEAVAPLIPEMANIARTFLQIALPVVNFTVDIINLLLNGLGPLSKIIRVLVSGAIFGGLIAVIGKVAGAFRMVGPIANGVTRIFSGIASQADKLAIPIGIVTGTLGLLQAAAEAVLGPLKDLLGVLDRLTGPLQSVGGWLVDVGAKALRAGGDLIGVGDAADTVGKKLGTLSKWTPGPSLFQMGIDLVNSLGGPILDLFDKFTEAFDQVTSASDAMKDAQKATADAQNDLNKLLREGRVDAEEVARAYQGVADAAEKVKDAELALSDARKSVTDSIKEQTEATLELEEARKPATADELSAAEDEVTRARIALAQATREAKEAEDELNNVSTQRINLAGLSLDQIRTQLANLKRSLAAQRAVAQADENAGKTKEEIEEEAILRQIDVRDAQRSVTEAEQDLQKVRLKGTDVDEEVIQAQEKLIDSTDRVAKARGNEEKAVRAVERAKRDEIAANAELAKAKLGDPEFDEKVAEARERITAAKEAEIDAQHRLNVAIATAAQDQEKLVALKFAELNANKALILQSPDLTRAFVNTFGDITQFLKPGIAPKFLGPDFIRAIAVRLLETPGSSLREVLKALGVPGLMTGGVVTSPMMARIGEFSKPEAVMPLTHPGNFFKTWNSALPYMHPQIRQSFNPQISTLNKKGSSGFTTHRSNRMEKLLEMILEELKKDQAGGVEVPITVNAAPHMSEELLAWKLSKKIKRELGRR